MNLRGLGMQVASKLRRKGQIRENGRVGQPQLEPQMSSIPRLAAKVLTIQ